MTDTVETPQVHSERRLTGTVRSRSGDKTINVVVNTLVKHPAYGKYVRQQTKLAVHDPKNQAGVGDVVEIAFCRRLSKSKSWRLTQVVRRNVAR